jgi:hypothetical protein
MSATQVNYGYSKPLKAYLLLFQKVNFEDGNKNENNGKRARRHARLWLAITALLYTGCRLVASRVITLLQRLHRLEWLVCLSFVTGSSDDRYMYTVHKLTTTLL